MKKIAIFLAALAVSALCGAGVSADSHGLSTADADYLVRAVAVSFPDVSYAVRVGIIEVVMNRVASAEYPETAAGVVASMAEFDVTAVSRDVSGEVLRLTRDALSAVLGGAGITGGALSFASADVPRKLDFALDNTAEAERSAKIYSALSHCPVIIDGYGFW